IPDCTGDLRAVLFTISTIFSVASSSRVVPWCHPPNECVMKRPRSVDPPSVKGVGDGAMEEPMRGEVECLSDAV
ncbi:hypothetical protein BGW80DRAFT_1284697, partial [Lactifluus volemus]